MNKSLAELIEIRDFAPDEAQGWCEDMQLYTGTFSSIIEYFACYDDDRWYETSLYGMTVIPLSVINTQITLMEENQRLENECDAYNKVLCKIYESDCDLQELEPFVRKTLELEDINDEQITN